MDHSIDEADCITSGAHIEHAYTPHGSLTGSLVTELFDARVCLSEIIRRYTFTQV